MPRSSSKTGNRAGSHRGSEQLQVQTKEPCRPEQTKPSTCAPFDIWKRRLSRTIELIVVCSMAWHSSNNDIGFNRPFGPDQIPIETVRRPLDRHHSQHGAAYAAGFR